MKKLKIFLPMSLVCCATTISMSSCATVKRFGVDYKIEDYSKTLIWNGYQSGQPFNILQISDLHLSDISDKDVEFNYIKKVVNHAKSQAKIKDSKIDLIVITGDLFDFATKGLVNDTIKLFESFQIPWTCIFGNHDEQNYFSIEWLTTQLNNASKNGYCKFIDLQDDNVFGNCNFVIDLQDEAKTSVEQLYFFDTNRYRYYGFDIGYDYIHQDQIDWYKWATEQYHTSKSLAFGHIPLCEFEEAYVEASSSSSTKNCEFIYDKNLGPRNKHEKDNKWHGAAHVNTHLYDEFVKDHKTQAMIVGHCHESSYCVKNVKDDISLCFGIKSTDKVYCDANCLGGQIFSLKKDGTFDIYGFYDKY